MAHVDRFTIPTWSMVAGNRAIEEMLFNIPADFRLAVWGGLGPTFATVNSIRELALFDPRKACIPVHVPLLQCNPGRAISFDTQAGSFLFDQLLDNLLGIRCVQNFYPQKGLLIVGLDLTVRNFAGRQSRAYALSSWILNGIRNGVEVLFLNSPGEKLHESFGVCVQSSLGILSFPWGLRNAFFDSTVEELVFYSRPQQIVIVASSWETAFYSAIGAVDLLLLEKANMEGELDYSQRLRVGERVRVMTTSIVESRSYPSVTLYQVLAQHLADDLGVVDLSSGPYNFHEPWEVSILPERR